jgi:hypothetical protein
MPKIARILHPPNSRVPFTPPLPGGKISDEAKNTTVLPTGYGRLVNPFFIVHFSTSPGINIHLKNAYYENIPSLPMSSSIN